MFFAFAAPVALVGLSFFDPFYGLMQQELYHVDSVFHLAGGLLTAHACAVGARHFSWWRHVPALARAGILVAVVAVIGIGWEWFEFLSDVFLGTHHQPSVADTMKDLLLDIGGAALLTIFKR